MDQKDSLQTAYSNNNLGRLFFEQGLLARSYDYFIRALSIFENLNDSSGLAYTYQSLANLYKSQRDYPKAESNYLKAIKIRLALGNTRDIMSAFSQTARFYQDNNQHDKALRYLHLADSAGQVIHDEINLAEVHISLSETFLNKGHLDEAEAICAEALKVIAEKKNMRMLPQAYISMGQIMFEKRDYVQAKKQFNLALAIAMTTKDIASKMEAHYFLWKISEKEKNKLSELSNLNAYLLLKDSIKDLDLARQVERLQFEIEIERKEQENELLKVDQVKTDAIIKQQRLSNIILAIIIVAVSSLGFIQWRSSKKRREINEKLAQQNQFIQNQRQEIIEQNEKLSRRNQQLSDINHEKDTLMSIVAHDLKSPLNRIKGIADLMEIEGGLSKDQLSYVRMTKDTTQLGLALIKDLLDVHMLEESVVPNYSTFDISHFLLEKTNTFLPAAEAKNIHLHIARVETIEVQLDTDYLHRIIDNLLTNAIKFSKRETTVAVSAGRENNELWISIADQGQGFSEKDRLHLFQKFKKLSARPTAGESSNGLGLAIVKTLVDRLKGSIDLVSEQGKGSEFIIRLPLKN
nr:tetratricopeptide repeat-containing sensor histidine kinase [Chryseolinea lacunae]